MSAAVVVLIGLSVGTYLLKAAGPVLLGRRRLPRALDVLASRVPAALLAALTVVATIGDGDTIHIDARVAGVAAAGVALWRRAPFVLVVVVAVAVTAATRLVIGG